MEYVILVDEKDTATGVMEKQEAHVRGALHRAVSVFLFNAAGELLLQQRAADKYHSGSLWTNTCCGHPRQGETEIEAANRRLYEEMGIHCQLQKAFEFMYNADMGNGLTEHEFDHVFVGYTDTHPIPNILEVEDWKYMSKEALEADIAENPAAYTQWFRICMEGWGDKLFNGK